MPLDIAVLGPTGEPDKMASIGAEVHVRLIRLARAHSLPALSKLSDYYADVDFSSYEVLQLMAEVEKLACSKGLDHELQSTLRAILEIIRHAATMDASVSAIAD